MTDQQPGNVGQPANNLHDLASQTMTPFIFNKQATFLWWRPAFWYYVFYRGWCLDMTVRKAHLFNACFRY